MSFVSDICTTPDCSPWQAHLLTSRMRENHPQYNLNAKDLGLIAHERVTVQQDTVRTLIVLPIHHSPALAVRPLALYTHILEVRSMSMNESSQ